MATTDALLLTWLTRLAGLFGENESVGGAANMTPFALMANSVVTASSAGDGNGDGVLVAGRLNHAVQVTAIAGSDTLNIEGTLDTTVGSSTVWVPISAGLTSVVANGITQFTGVYGRIRARKLSGSGTATSVKLLSRA